MTRPRHGRSCLLLSVVAVLALGGCAAAELTLPEPVSSPSAAPTAFAPTPRQVAEATVRVAHPAAPERLVAPDPFDLAGQDLQAIWGLPLLRHDDRGQLRPGLAADWAIGMGDGTFEVVLRLADGKWSDGEAVTAEDVVATANTATAWREHAPVSDVRASGPDTVTFAFDRPYANWADLLVRLGPIHPAAVLDDGLPTSPEVSGGPFRLIEHVPGRSLVFEAHVDGPLGTPLVGRLEVLVVPRYDTALGLLEDGAVDALVGYTALNPVARAEQIEGVTATAPLGGTWVSLQARRSGALGVGSEQIRQRVAAALDVSPLVEGLLGGAGERITTPWFGVPSPVPPAEPSSLEGLELVLLSPAADEVAGFTARAVARDLGNEQADVDLVSEPTPDFVRAARDERDVALVVRRDPPRPPLSEWVRESDVAAAVEADAAGWPSSEARQALTALASAADLVPLYRVGVLHAWRDTVAGMRPSAWPGTGFWNVADWRIVETA